MSSAQSPQKLCSGYTHLQPIFGIELPVSARLLDANGRPRLWTRCGTRLGLVVSCTATVSGKRRGHDSCRKPSCCAWRWSTLPSGQFSLYEECFNQAGSHSSGEPLEPSLHKICRCRMICSLCVTRHALVRDSSSLLDWAQHRR